MSKRLDPRVKVERRLSRLKANAYKRLGRCLEKLEAAGPLVKAR